jgi:TetR/AcrR family transcriptional regulator
VYQIYLKMIFQEKFPYRAEFLQQVHLFSADYLTPLVEAGIERGDLRSDLDIETTVFMLDAVMDRFLQAYSVPFLDAGVGLYRAEAGEIEERIDRLIGLLKQGLRRSEEQESAATGTA